MSSTSSRTVASARRRFRPVRLALAVGTVLLIVGLGLVVADADSRLDAAERAVSFSAEEEAQLGEDAEGYIDYLQLSAFLRSMLVGTDVPTYEVRRLENADADDGFTIDESPQYVVAPMMISWHALPVTLPAFCGLALVLATLFFGAGRWHRRSAERSSN